MLNEPLLNALKTLYDEGAHVIYNDTEATYSFPTQKISSFIKTKQKKYATVSGWGEIYVLRCPICDDHTPRLFVSYVSLQRVMGPGSKVPYEFGMVAHCKNENCQISKLSRDILECMEAGDSYVPTVMPKKASNVRAPNCTGLPDVYTPQHYQLKDTLGVPQSCIDYVYSRGYTEDYLFDKFNVGYLPEGVRLSGEDEEYVKLNDVPRLYLPIIQGGKVRGWQARDITDTSKKKYVFAKGLRKSQLLYNLDNARKHAIVALTEGVTDVWRIGDDIANGIGAVCSFGKKLSPAQETYLKHVFSYDGTLVICYDSDAYDESVKLADRLREEGCFPGGVAVVMFPEGCDPDSYQQEQIVEIIQTAAESAYNQERTNE